MDATINAIINNDVLNIMNKKYNNIKTQTNINDITVNNNENIMDNVNIYNNKKEMIEKLNFNNTILSNIIKENEMIKKMFIDYAKKY